MLEGVDGLLREKTPPSRKPPLPEEAVARGVELTIGPPPGEVTHWTAAAPSTTKVPNPSSGPKTPTRSSPRSNEGTKR